MKEFIRIDMVRQTLFYHGLLEVGRKEPASETARTCANLDARLPQLRRAVQLVSAVVGLQSRGRYREAGLNCNKAIQFAPDYGMAYLRRAELYLHYCAAHWRNLTTDQKNQYIKWASEDVRRGDKFLQEWHTAPTILRAYTSLYSNLASPAAADVRQNLASVEELLGRPPQPLDDMEQAVLVMCRANCRFALGDIDGARRDFDEAIRLAPHEPQGYRNRAFFWKRRNRLDLAAADLEIAERLPRAIP